MDNPDEKFQILKDGFPVSVCVCVCGKNEIEEECFLQHSKRSKWNARDKLWLD